MISLNSSKSHREPLLDLYLLRDSILLIPPDIRQALWVNCCSQVTYFWVIWWILILASLALKVYEAITQYIKAPNQNHNCKIQLPYNLYIHREKCMLFGTYKKRYTRGQIHMLPPKESLCYLEWWGLSFLWSCEYYWIGVWLNFNFSQIYGDKKTKITIDESCLPEVNTVFVDYKKRILENARTLWPYCFMSNCRGLLIRLSKYQQLTAILIVKFSRESIHFLWHLEALW